MDHGRLTDGLPPVPQRDECFDELCRLWGGARIERIVSDGQTSPEGFWYDQDWDEWVMVVEGEAVLEWEQPRTTQTLRPMNWVLIPAGTRHRVARTNPRTIWLAVHGSRHGQGD